MKVSILLFLLFLFVSGTPLLSQDCSMLYPVKEGTLIEYKDYDSKDKLNGSSIQEISNLVEDGNNITVTVNHESFDKKGEKLMDGEFEVKCIDGIFYMDMRNMLDDAALSAYEGMEIEMDANDMAYTFDMQAGTTLPDASITVGVSSNGMKIFTMTVFITNRHVEARESVTTPAGTFECYKIAFDIETKMMVKVQAKAIQWIAEDVGMVRAENYNKKGKLQGYTILSKIY